MADTCGAAPLRVFVIGQSPRLELEAEIAAATPGLRIRLEGALDGMTREEIARDAAPRDGADTLFTVLPSGESTTLSKAFVTGRLAVRLAACEEPALLCCTGAFAGLPQRADLVQPAEVLNALAEALLPSGRLGVVGGTNTDAVLLDGDRIVAAIKTSTTEDVLSGVRQALREVTEAAGTRDVRAVMIGTTHFVNAVVQRRDLARAGAIRLGMPMSSSLPPFCDWPADLAALVRGGVHMVEGGHDYDGRPIMPLDERGVAAAARALKAGGVDCVAISSIFSPLDPGMEIRAGEIVRQEHPGASITLSHELGRIGLLERENVALLNASLAPLARHTVRAFEQALADAGLKAALYVTQNDGTVIRAELAERFPVLSFASGPTNSMRGAAFLTGLKDALVIDVGGTTSDVGALRTGFPREANAVVEVGGVRTLFRMPDLYSIGLGGGSLVTPSPLAIGPRSVGFRLQREARVFGGGALTTTDIAVAGGRLSLGDAAWVKDIPAALVKDVLALAARMLEEAVDRMKTDAAEVPLLAVGGGAFIVPDHLPGASEVLRPPHAHVANAVGAAIAQVSGEADQVFQGLSRAEALAEAERIAREKAVASGAAPGSLALVDLEDLPIAYLPGGALRVRARVVGDIAA